MYHHQVLQFYSFYNIAMIWIKKIFPDSIWFFGGLHRIVMSPIKSDSGATPGCSYFFHCIFLQERQSQPVEPLLSIQVTTEGYEIQREVGVKSVAPPPTGQPVSRTMVYGVAVCSWWQYNLPHRGDFWISFSNLRYQAQKGHFGAFWRSQKLFKNDYSSVYISGIRWKFRNRLGEVNCNVIHYKPLPHMLLWHWLMRL